MFELLTLALHGLALIMLLRIARALERLASPPEVSGPFDYHAAEKKGLWRRRSGLYNANRDLHLPK